MTALPQLVAAFHSLVGLAAVFVVIGAYKNPSAFDGGIITTGSMIEMSLGLLLVLLHFLGPSLHCKSSRVASVSTSFQRSALN